MNVLAHIPPEDARSRASAPSRHERPDDELTTTEILVSDLGIERDDLTAAERARRRANAYLERRRRRLQAELASRDGTSPRTNRAYRT